MSIETREIIGKPVFEKLEGRDMLSTVTLTEGVLVVRGKPSSPNQLAIHTENNKVWAVTENGSSEKIAISNVKQIRIIGGEKNDIVNVEAGVRIPVYVQTGNGNDTVQTADGKDIVVAGNGRDSVSTGANADIIYGGNGNDTVNAGSGKDAVIGANGSDSIDDGKGNDYVAAGSGDDSVHSGAGRDLIVMGVGKDYASGISNDDNIESDSKDQVDRLPPGQSGNTPPQSNDDDETVPSALPIASSFTLINAETNKPISGYENVSGKLTVDLSKLPTTKLNIRANFDGKFDGSVVFGYNGDSSFNTENNAPFTFNVDSSNARPWTPTVGNHTIYATAYSEDDGTGTAGATAKLKLEVKETVANEPTPEPENPQTDPTPDPDVEPTPDPSGGTEAPNGVITMMSSTMTTSHAVHVNGIASKMKAGSLLTAKFQWDFGDSSSPYNKLVGWNAAHRYTQPGKYTIKLTITNENNKTSVITKTINISASDRKVIYVSNDGSDSNSGSESSPLKSFSKAMSLVNDDTEVLFKRGDKFDVSKGATIDNTNVVIGAYGNGAKPVLNFSGARNYSSIITTNGRAKDVTIENITFDSVHDNNFEKTGMPDAVHAGGDNISVVGVTFRNIGYGMNSNLKPSGVLMQECDAPAVNELRSYLCYAQGSDMVFLGNQVSNATREHCLRVDGADRVLIAYNDFTNQDRRPMGDKLDTAKQTITVHHGSYAYIYGNTTHDGRVEIGPLGEADGLKASNIVHRLNYVRIEANDFNFSPNNRLEIDHGTNNVMINDNKISVTSHSGISIQAAGKYTQWKGYGDRHVENVIVTGDNQITGAKNKVSVGQGAVGVKVLPSGSPVYVFKAAA